MVMVRVIVMAIVIAIVRVIVKVIVVVITIVTVIGLVIVNVIVRLPVRVIVTVIGNSDIKVRACTVMRNRSIVFCMFLIHNSSFQFLTVVSGEHVSDHEF